MDDRQGRIAEAERLCLTDQNVLRLLPVAAPRLESETDSRKWALPGLEDARLLVNTHDLFLSPIAIPRLGRLRELPGNHGSPKHAAILSAS